MACLMFALGVIPLIALGNSDGNDIGQEGGHNNIAFIFLAIAMLLMSAKIGGLVERLGQPSVLGELIMGVALGNLGLFGIYVLEPIRSNEIIKFLAELGVVILLFQIGLESNIEKMKKVGVRAFLVAMVGVMVPFVLGTYIVGPLLLPGLSTTAYLFLGATLTATSVGITARVFKDLKKLHLPEAQIVLGAAVIDDVIGLIILAIVSAIATVGSVSVGAVSVISLKALAFLVGAIIIGQLSAPMLGRWISRIHTGTGMKFTLAISFAFILAFIAQKIGLAPIVGAFAAGLVLDPVHFKFFKEPEICEKTREVIKKSDKETKKSIEQILNNHTEKHVEELIEPLGHFLVPIFFVITGMGVDLKTLTNIPVLITALGITFIAFVGKLCSGIVAGKKMNKLLIGFGMVPRGEVGLIFAIMGKTLGVISNEMFSIIVIMVILSTLLTPPILTALLKKHKE